MTVEERFEEAETWTADAEEDEVNVTDDGSEDGCGGAFVVGECLSEQSWNETLPCRVNNGHLPLVHNNEV